MPHHPLLYLLENDYYGRLMCGIVRKLDWREKEEEAQQ